MKKLKDPGRRSFLKRSALTGLGALGSASPVLAHWYQRLQNESPQEKKGNIQLTFEKFDLQLKHVWKIARGSRATSTIILTKIIYDGVTGYGEAALPTSGRYGETPETVISFLEKVDLRDFGSPFLAEDIIEYLNRIAPGNNAAKASVDIALHDWIGKKLGVPLYQLLGLNISHSPVSTFSIGLDTIEMMKQKVIEAQSYPVLKIKVGQDNDKEIITAIRSVTDKPLRVDANEGWKTKEVALERILWLQDQGIEVLEQPLPEGKENDMKWLHPQVKLPMLADESVLHLTDIPKLKDGFDGIVIKLQKSGGIREALRMIHGARMFNMKIMLGCMIESSVSIAAAAHLTPLVDYVDLDGNVLVSNDPFMGLENDHGKLVFSGKPGLGVEKR
jgi:L-alanine-DL-glutamate epimerase-like enolase superfamily enzyme